MTERSLKRAILILFMPHEEEVTRLAVQSICLQLRPDDQVFVLLNGGNSSDWKDFYSGFPQLTYIESPVNLGVAGGRNRLLSQDWVQAADIIYLVDNDAIVPNDYLDQMQDFLLQNPDAGVVGPLVLNYRSLAEKYQKLSADNVKRRLGNGNFFSSGELLALLRGSLNHEDVDHAGTLQDYDYAYFSPEAFLRRLFIDSGFHHGSIPSLTETGNRKLYANINQASPEPWQVSNIAGCCQVFSVSLLKELGSLDDRFNPYGYEDVDFCIRAIESGKQNIVTPNVYMLHRTDLRHADRTSLASAFKVQKNLSRSFAILESKHRADQFPALSLERIYFKNLLDKVINPAPSVNHPDRRMGLPNVGRIARYKGLKQAAQQLYLDSPEDFRTLLNGLQNDLEKQLLAHFVHSLPHAVDDEIINSLANAFSPMSNSKGGKLAHADIGLDRYVGKEVEYDANASMGSFSVRKYQSSQQEEISEEDEDRIRSLHNKYLGKRCFIVGNGPSLNKTDFSFLKDEFTFGVNSIYLMEGMNGFRPTFYTVEDNHVVDDNLDEIRRMDAVHKFFPAKYERTIGREANNYFLPVNWEFYYASSPFHNVPRFSKDISKTLYVGQTVTYLNFQIAYYLGFREIYIIGVDFHYEIPNSASIEGNSILSADADPNHFHPEYFGAGKKWHLPKLENCYKAYCHANQFANENGFSIQDATIGGKLDAFPKVDFYEVVGAKGQPVEPNKPLNKAIAATVDRVLGTCESLDVKAHAATELNPSDLEFSFQHSNFAYTGHGDRHWVFKGRETERTYSLEIMPLEVFISEVLHRSDDSLVQDRFFLLDPNSSIEYLQTAFVELIPFLHAQGLRVVFFYGSILILPLHAEPSLDLLIGIEKPLRDFSPFEFRTLMSSVAVLEGSRVKTRNALISCIVDDDAPLNEIDEEGGMPYPGSAIHPADAMLHLMRLECGFVYDGRYVYFSE